MPSQAGVVLSDEEKLQKEVLELFPAAMVFTGADVRERLKNRRQNFYRLGLATKVAAAVEALTSNGLLEETEKGRGASATARAQKLSARGRKTDCLRKRSVQQLAGNDLAESVRKKLAVGIKHFPAAVVPDAEAMDADLLEAANAVIQADDPNAVPLADVEAEPEAGAALLADIEAEAEENGAA